MASRGSANNSTFGSKPKNLPPMQHSPNMVPRGSDILNQSPDRGAASQLANGRSTTPKGQIVLEGFGGFEDANSDDDLQEHEGQCYLKTKTESYKKHWMKLSGNELRFYRKMGDAEHKVMHCLAGTYLKEVTMDEISEKSKS